MSDLPHRSRLYHLAPLGIGTSMIESLTSYINRLAWTYRINPSVLVTQEIIPRLSKAHQLSSYKSGSSIQLHAMRINGPGELAVDWSTTLEGLTMRADLRYLNVHMWAAGLPTITLLRTTPAWCPLCYQDWRKDGSPIYQPLLWMLQVVTICLKHRKKLASQCSHCQRHHYIFTSNLQPGGYCKTCKAGLETVSTTVAVDRIDDDTFAWQEWVVRVIEELRVASTQTEIPSWENVRSGLDVCRKNIGRSKQLALVVNVPEVSLSRWINGKNMPSLESLLKLCYVLDISPLLLLTSDSSNMEEAIRIYRPPRPRNPAPLPKKQEGTLELIQAVIDGREVPPSVAWIERHLGLSRNTVVYHYPEEAAFISAQYLAYRKDQARRRLEYLCNEVRAATFSLHARGVFPSMSQVSCMLPNPNWLREPKAMLAWHTARRELGLEA